ncbi:MAG: glucosaminidase domain-containing protein [Magnetovibrio sp.]|nr:glucosaminidase domain-containing protein [Magnetovibrio sp.]
MDTQIQDARLAISTARTTGIFSPAPYTITLPEKDEVPTQMAKSLFVAKILPKIILENARIRKQREQLLSPNINPAHLNALAKSYGVEPAGVSKTELLKRIDKIPPSLVLAQAAIESAWGTSRFARLGNAYFGERTFDLSAPGIKPLRAEGFKVKSFPSSQMSVRSYMRTLNSHSAYKALRQHRANLRKTSQISTGIALADHLQGYSEIGDDYIAIIKSTIQNNDFDDFDQVKLAHD